MTDYIKDRAIGIHNMIDVWVDGIPDDLQGLTAVLVFYLPWFRTCAKPLLVGWNELLSPSVVDLHALREVGIRVLCLALTGLVLARLLLGRRHVRFFDSDRHLKGKKNDKMV